MQKPKSESISETTAASAAPAGPASIAALEIPARTKPSNYPAPFAARFEGRVKRQLGDFFGLKKFGVNLTILEPNAESSLLHKHSKQEEFIYVLEGTPTLVLENEERLLVPGTCAGFPPAGVAHKLVNRSLDKVVYLEVGDREQGDEGSYPADDLKAVMGRDGQWRYTRKDGSPL